MQTENTTETNATTRALRGAEQLRRQVLETLSHTREAAVGLAKQFPAVAEGHLDAALEAVGLVRIAKAAATTIAAEAPADEAPVETLVQAPVEAAVVETEAVATEPSTETDEPVAATDAPDADRQSRRRRR